MANPNGNPGNLTPFAPGKSGNPGGRPKRASKSELLAVLYETVTVEDMEAIVRHAITQAKNGNRFAREYLSLYLLGRPKPMDEDDNSGVAALIALLAPKPKAIEEETYVLLDTVDERDD